MNIKKTLVSFFILVFLCLSVYLYERNTNEDISSKSHQYVNLFEGMDTGSIQNIVIKSGKVNLLMMKENNTWQLKQPFEFPAKSSGVDGLLQKITAADKATCVSLNEKNDKKFGVDDTSGLHVMLNDKSKTVLDIVIGRYTSDYFSNYIRIKNGRKGIWSLGPALKRNIFPNANMWIRKKIFPELDRQNIMAIQVQHPDGEYIFKKNKNDTWVMQLPLKREDIGQDNIERLVGHLMMLSILSVPEPVPEESILSPGDTNIVHIKWREKSGEEGELDVYDLDGKKNPYARVTFATRPVLISRVQIDDIKKDIKKTMEGIPVEKKTNTPEQ